ncbi:nucleolar protein dao-5-like [Cydia amplana]|uniref:nucleolar protein dao-5-like n=1 Tax=Cydia amplana TaxID=1869771 RepID=UPI002FE693DC
MSQMVTRQRTGGDENEKRQTDSPVRDMKKKMAANAEKEKNAAEQATSKPAEKLTDKSTEKPAEKPKAAEKPADKKDKAPEKPIEKKDKAAEKDKPVEKKDKAPEKPVEKKDKPVEKPVEKKDKPADKLTDKKEGQSEKKKEENGKGESSGKIEKPAANGRPKQNGSTTTNGTVSPDSDSISDADETEQFPELAYDDSDVDWEPGMDCPSRSFTRREQVTATLTAAQTELTDSVSDVDETEQFPELAYDDSDVDWEPGMECPSRSLTRREQVTAILNWTLCRRNKTGKPAATQTERRHKRNGESLGLGCQMWMKLNSSRNWLTMIPTWIGSQAWTVQAGASPGANRQGNQQQPKQNGSINGTVSPTDSVSDVDETEQFPELAYDDSDVDWEPGMDCPSRSFTRREQVKATRTPETPRPASDKQDTDDSKESKVLKLTESGKDTPKDKKTEAKSDAKSEAKSDSKSDGKSPKSDAKKAETPKKDETVKVDAKKDVKESPKKGKEDKSEIVEVEVVVEIENNGDASEESRKPDTNFSKSRVKVSPYRRSMRLADQTTSSIAANYTGNNTTMEMDITESSSFMDDTMDDSYLSGLRSIKGRRSYKLLKDMPPRTDSANRSVRSVTSITVSETSSRPTAPVVGRKRKPEPEDSVSIASEAREADSPIGKRQRLLERLARPFKRTVLMPARRNAEIVGINTDLPLTAPVASTSNFDPETLKTAADIQASPAALPVAAAPTAEDAKRCVIM